MTVGELKKLLRKCPNYLEVFVATEEEDGEDILTVEVTDGACFIVYENDDYFEV